MSIDFSEMVRENLKAAAEVSRVAYQTGHTEGYRMGYKDGIAAAQKLINEYLTEMRKPE